MISDPLPAGLAVDNGGGATQSRVYVTSGNTALAGVYAYPPGAATTNRAAAADGLLGAEQRRRRLGDDRKRPRSRQSSTGTKRGNLGRRGFDAPLSPVALLSPIARQRSRRRSDLRRATTAIASSATIERDITESMRPTRTLPSRMSLAPKALIAIATAAALALAGCGGGGDTASTSAATTRQNTITAPPQRPKPKQSEGEKKSGSTAQVEEHRAQPAKRPGAHRPQPAAQPGHQGRGARSGHHQGRRQQHPDLRRRSKQRRPRPGGIHRQGLSRRPGGGPLGRGLLLPLRLGPGRSSKCSPKKRRDPRARIARA